MSESIPVLVRTPAPKTIPDPFGKREEFMYKLATSEEHTLRPQHFIELGDGDELRERQAVVNGMNYLREATDLGIITTNTKQVEGRPVVLYGPTEEAYNFWTESVKDGHDPKKILDGWIALRELMDTITQSGDQNEAGA